MDVDIDVQSDIDVSKLFPTAVSASMIRDNELTKHQAGVYFQTMPIDKLTGLAAIPYDYAEQFGFTKIDLLHLSFLQYFQSKQEILVLLRKQPDWLLLQSAKVVAKLFQLHNHANLVRQLNIASIHDLADATALIRPLKRKFVEPYLQDKDSVRKTVLYVRENGDKSSFCKSHAYAYAHIIMLQLHLIGAKII